MTKLSQTEKARRMLRRAGRVTNGDFVRARILRYGQRIAELRKLGLHIETEHVRGGTWAYILKRRKAA